MKLYKYVSSEVAVKNIIDGRIKFATLDSLNDPTELLPKIYEKELIHSLKDKRKNGYNSDDLEDLKIADLQITDLQIADCRLQISRKI